MELENSGKESQAQGNLEEELKVEHEKPQEIKEIVTDKKQVTFKDQIKEEKLMEKLSEEPVKQKKDFLKDLTRKEVKASYDLHKRLASIPRKILNRRYKRLQQLIEGESDYFSEEAIRAREPILYFLYVGRYLRDGEAPNKPLSEVLLEQAMIDDWKQQLEKELKETGYLKDVDFDEKIEISPEELEDNTDEMMRLLHDRFVAGLDKHVNYEEIDENEDLDDEQIIRQDAEDEYFGGEEPEDLKEEQKKSEYTGVQDY